MLLTQWRRFLKAEVYDEDDCVDELSTTGAIRVSLEGVGDCVLLGQPDGRGNYVLILNQVIDSFLDLNGLCIGPCQSL